MMNCKRTKQYLMNSLDGTLLPKNQDDLAGHLEVCTKCQNELDYQIHLARRLELEARRFKQDLKIPSGLLYDILREIRNVPEPKPAWIETLSLIFRLPVYAHAVLIITLSAFITLSAMTIENIGERRPRRLEASASAYLHLAKSRSLFQGSPSKMRSRTWVKIKPKVVIHKMPRGDE